MRVLDKPAKADLNWNSSKPKPNTSSSPFRIYNIGSNNPVKLNIISLYPNPFNPEITMKLDYRYESNISIEIFDVSGHIITTLKEGFLSPGEYEFKWNAKNESTGIYFFKISYGSHQIIRKAILLK